MPQLLANLEITISDTYEICNQAGCQSDMQPGEEIYRYVTFNEIFLLCGYHGKVFRQTLEDYKKKIFLTTPDY